LRRFAERIVNKGLEFVYYQVETKSSIKYENNITNLVNKGFNLPDIEKLLKQIYSLLLY